MKKLVLPNYEILGEMAKGGMSTIYRARQLSLGRLVALKVLRGELVDNERVRQRFKREALAVSVLSHENIVSVYDMLEIPDGLCLVMEYVEGANLQQVLAAVGALHPAIASLIFLQVVRALEYAHREGFVHRDIKPANILLNAKGVVKLADFGIVKAARFVEVTLPGTFLGTPRYMSPEQSLGMRIDFRSDLFSLGTCWYEAICGKPLFQGLNSEVIIRQVRHKKIIPLHHSMFSVPTKVSRMIQRCLQRSPRRRFNSTEILRKRLERELVHQVGIDLREPLVALLQESTMPATKKRKKSESQVEYRLWSPRTGGYSGRRFNLLLARRVVGCLLAIIVLALFAVGLVFPQRRLPGTKGWPGLAGMLKQEEKLAQPVFLDGYPYLPLKQKGKLRFGAHVLNWSRADGSRQRASTAPKPQH